MSEPRYLVLDESGIVTNTVIGFVDLPAVGFIEQTEELLRVGPFWVYDAELDDFTNPYGSMPPVVAETDTSQEV